MTAPNTETITTTITMPVNRVRPTTETIDLVTDVNRYLNKRNGELTRSQDVYRRQWEFQLRRAETAERERDAAIATMRDLLVDVDLDCLPRADNTECPCSIARAHRIVDAHTAAQA